MKRLGLVLLALVILLIILAVCRFLYLDRFIVYKNGHATLNYDQKLESNGLVPQSPDPEEFPFETILDTSHEANMGETLSKLNGFYVSTTMLAEDVDAVRDALWDAEDYNAVVIDVKSVYGNFYYSSKLAGAQKATADIEAIDKLIAQLCARNDLTVIARVPAFSDPNYALAHQSQGLPLLSGALWTDDNGCYWINPYSNDVQGWLTSIAIELESLGFDEVLFDNFYFPDSDRILWKSDTVTKQDAILDAASNLAANLVSTPIRVSYGTNDPQIAAFADRVFITTEKASDVKKNLAALKDTLPDSAGQIVFCTTSRDTRFNQCGTIHPLMGESN